ncbi:hypothetical protein H4S08_000686 [Coemansia sp. RSA 1365]|nr:hypothetical protein H4S08_000686 [Coemansia sp. RSA 1365]
MSSSRDYQNTTTDEFLKDFILKAKQNLEKNPVKPDSVGDLSLLINDNDAPKNWRRFYNPKEIEKIAEEKCQDCEIKWLECVEKPTGFLNRYFECRFLREELDACKERVQQEIGAISGKEPLVKSQDTS